MQYRNQRKEREFILAASRREVGVSSGSSMYSFFLLLSSIISYSCPTLHLQKYSLSAVSTAAARLSSRLRRDSLLLRLLRRNLVHDW